MPRSLFGSGPNLLIQTQLACVRTVSQYRVGRKRLSYPVNIFNNFFFFNRTWVLNLGQQPKFQKFLQNENPGFDFFFFPLASAKTFDFDIDFFFVFYSFTASGLILKTKWNLKLGGVG